jgi:hypothetical protein
VINNEKQNDEAGTEWERIAGATAASEWERWRNELKARRMRIT